MRELATKADLRSGLMDLRAELKTEISDAKHEILKWVIATILAQTAIIAALIGVVLAWLPK